MYIFKKACSGALKVWLRVKGDETIPQGNVSDINPVYTVTQCCNTVTGRITKISRFADNPYYMQTVPLFGSRKQTVLLLCWNTELGKRHKPLRPERKPQGLSTCFAWRMQRFNSQYHMIPVHSGEAQQSRKSQRHQPLQIRLYFIITSGLQLADGLTWGALPKPVRRVLCSKLCSKK